MDYGKTIILNFLRSQKKKAFRILKQLYTKRYDIKDIFKK